MHNQSNDKRKHEGDVSKGLPEAAPNAGNAYEEDDHPANDAPKDHGEVPRKMMTVRMIKRILSKHHDMSPSAHLTGADGDLHHALKPVQPL